MYFLFFKLHSWGKRFGSSRRRLIQTFPSQNFPFCHCEEGVSESFRFNCRISTASTVGEGLDPPLHPRPFPADFREGQDPPLRLRIKKAAVYYRSIVSGYPPRGVGYQTSQSHAIGCLSIQT